MQSIQRSALTWFSLEMEAYLARTLYLFFVVVPVQICGIESFCIATSVSVGETASISCHFSEDLSKSPEGQRDVNVYLYKVLDENEPELVFSYQCVNGMTRILRAQGYENKSSLSDHLEIVIYNATKKHAGLYKCSILPSNEHRATLCSLKINEDSNSVLTENSTATKTNYADLHSSSDSTVNGNAGKRDDVIETEKGSTTIILAVVIPILLILTAIIIIVILVIRYKKRRKRQRGGCRPLQNNTEMGQPASSHDDLKNNAGVPHIGSVNRQGTTDVDEISNVLLPGDSHPSHDEPTQDNNEMISFTKE